MLVKLLSPNKRIRFLKNM